MRQSTGEDKQDARDELAHLRQDKQAINAEILTLQQQKNALFTAGMRLLLLSRDWWHG